MSDDEQHVELLWRMYQEQMTWCRHVDIQRATANGTLFAVASVVLTVIGYGGIRDAGDVPLIWLVVFIGIVGVLLALKYHERFTTHYARAKGYLRVLDTILPGGRLRQIKEDVDFRRSQYRSAFIKMVAVHVTLEVIIVLIGFALLAYAWGWVGRTNVRTLRHHPAA